MKAFSVVIWTFMAFALLGNTVVASAEEVRFELDRPTAKAVFIAGEMTDWDRGKVPMRRSADGKWHAELDLPPGQWLYKFVVDGEWIADPATNDNDGDGNGGRHSFVFVGNGPWRENDNIRHGRVETTMLPSAAWGKVMKVNVYLPPGFNKRGKYPVLLLLHGAGMDADQWYRTGHIERYMDNMIADKSIVPFVVVMPSSERVYYIDQSDKHITDEIPRWLLSHYGQTLVASRAATAGMSMGGFGAVNLPLHHPDMFGLSYALSSYFPPEEIARMPVPEPLPFRLVMFTGDRDHVTESAPLFLNKLNQHQAQFSYEVDAGAHTWNYFSRHTANLLRTVSQYFAPARSLDRPASAPQGR